MDLRRALTLLAVAVFTIHALHYWPSWIDDAYITFRYAHDLRTGVGMVYNAGERVEGITNLGWGLLLAAFTAGDALLAAKLFGLAFGIGTVVLLGEWLRDQALPLPAIALGLTFAVVYPWLPSYAMYGLETDAAAFFVTLAWTRHGREADGRSRLPLAALGMALAPWVRPDGALAAILCGGWHLVRRGPKLTRAAGVAVGIVLLGAGALVALKLHWYGAILPNTALTKLREWPPERGFVYLRNAMAWPSPGLAWLAAGAALWGVGRVVRREDRALPGIFAAVGVAAAVAQNGDFMQNFRFFVPIWPALSAAVAVFVADLARVHRWAPAAALAATLPAWPAVAAVQEADRLHDADFRGAVIQKSRPFFLPELPGAASTFAQRFSFPAAWSVVHRTARDTLAYVNIGLLGWTSEGPVLDMLGLTDPSMGRRFSRPDADAAWAHLEADATFVMLDVPDGEWGRYRDRLAEGGWVLFDGCPPYWIFANPAKIEAYRAPTVADIEPRLDEALHRAPRNPALLTAIGRELAWVPADPALFERWSAAIAPHVGGDALASMRCAAGMAPGCTWTPTCDVGHPRLEVSRFAEAESWPTPTHPEPKRRAKKGREPAAAPE
jgi:hypothetical protein